MPRALAESEVRSVVITGEGDIFSAGVDLVRLVEGGADYVERFLPAMSRALEELFFFPKPVIARPSGAPSLARAGREITSHSS